MSQNMLFYSIATQKQKKNKVFQKRLVLTKMIKIFVVLQLLATFKPIKINLMMRKRGSF